ncbi:MAG: phosphotransferase family protein [Oscillospiraceae bacterium]|nr:phosphotransferase family protein [Oscillospiraceae bacterium]
MNKQAHDNFPAPADAARFGLLTPHDLRVIGAVLHANPEDVTGVSALKQGMTNRSFLFSCRGEQYIMRVPGEGTGRLINRPEEAAVYRLIQGQGLCEDVLYIDPDSGYKISRFIEDARTCDPLNERETAACMDKLRSFHGLGLRADHEFDLFGHIDFYESLWDGRPSAYPDYRETKENIFRLKPFLDAQAGGKVLTHIDAVPDNFLFFRNDQGQEEIRLIDWEYAAMQDPHVDIAMFCIYAMYDRAQADRLIDQYFTEGCLPLTRVKVYGYIAVCGLLWSNWCEYKRSLGVEFGAYSLAQYRYAQNFCEIVRDELEKLGEDLP